MGSLHAPPIDWQLTSILDPTTTLDRAQYSSIHERVQIACLSSLHSEPVLWMQPPLVAPKPA